MLGDKKAKNRKLHLSTFQFLFILLVLCCLLLTAATLYYINNRINTYLPANPSQFGTFPKNPIWLLDVDETVIASPVVRIPIGIVRTNKSLVGFNINSGEMIWQVPSMNHSHLSIAPWIVGDFIIVSENDSAISAFAIENGELIWRHSPDVSNFPIGEVMGALGAINSSDDIVFVARNSWNLTAYQIHTGNILWQKELPSRVSVDLEVYDEKVYLSASNSIQMYDAKSGTLLINQTYPWIINPILIDSKRIFMVVFDDKSTTSILAVHNDTFAEDWSVPGEQIEDEVDCLKIDDSNLFAAGNRMTAIDEESGLILWSTDVIGPLECPVFSEDQIFVRNSLSKLYLINKSNGEILGWMTVRTNSGISSDPERSPTIANGILIVPFGDGRIFGYRP